MDMRAKKGKDKHLKDTVYKASEGVSETGL